MGGGGEDGEGREGEGWRAQDTGTQDTRFDSEVLYLNEQMVPDESLAPILLTESVY